MNNRQIDKSKIAIKNAFISLLSEQEFNQITIQDISDKANIGRRTFYNHYIDKYDLLTNLIQDHLNELGSICYTSRKSDNTDAKSSDWFDYFEKNHQFFTTMLNGSGKYTFRSVFYNFVHRELKEFIDTSSGINANINEDILFCFLTSAIVGVIEAYFTDDAPISAHDLKEQVMILLDRNI